jgi:CelD/BcsL family acetyltransferase involved in cellulose biosynthesis
LRGQYTGAARLPRCRAMRAMTGKIEFVLAPIESQATLESTWRGTAARVQPYFFLSWGWIGTWLATLPADLKPLLLTARRDGTAIGVAIVMTRTIRQTLRATATGFHLHSTGDPRWDCISIEHNGFLCAPADAADLAAEFFEWFAGDAAAGEELRLPGVELPYDTTLLDHRGFLHNTKQQAGFTADLAAVESSGDPAALFSRNARQQFHRTQRDYAKLGAVTITAARDTAEALVYFRALKALHVESWQRRKQRHAFSEPYFEIFHEALIAREFAAGSVQLLRIAAGPETVGYLYNFVAEGRVSAYQSGFDDLDRKRRPGVLSHSLAIEWNAARGARIYDFLAGENQLKASFANGASELAWQVIRRPLFKFRLESAARHWKQKFLG